MINEIIFSIITYLFDKDILSVFYTSYNNVSTIDCKLFRKYTLFKQDVDFNSNTAYRNMFSNLSYPKKVIVDKFVQSLLSLDIKEVEKQIEIIKREETIKNRKNKIDELLK